ncbi:MAG: 50S ribosomal protein L11 [Candidatus Aenigmatarchaeota archaeon]
MAEKDVIELLVEGGKASPGPTTAPKLSAYKLNVGEVFKKINEKTKEYEGLQVPVKIIVDKEKGSYEIEVGIPPVASLIKKELGFVKPEKGAEGEKKQVFMGDLKLEQCIKIAKIKMPELLVKDLKSAVKCVIGTAVSMPLTIEGKKPKEILKEIEEGKYDNLFKS